LGSLTSIWFSGRETAKVLVAAINDEVVIADLLLLTLQIVARPGAQSVSTKGHLLRAFGVFLLR
jgi:hypothetical protein